MISAVSVPLPEFFLPINGSSIGPTMDDTSVGPIFLGNFPFFGANESVIYVGADCRIPHETLMMISLHIHIGE